MKYIADDVQDAVEEFVEQDEYSVDYEEWASETFVKAKKHVFTGFNEGTDMSDEYIKNAQKTSR